MKALASSSNPLGSPTARADRPAYPYLEEVNEGIVRQFRRLPCEFLPAGSVGRVLDVGCGRGVLAGALRELGWQAWGVEEHPQAVAAARERVDRLIEGELTDRERMNEALAGQVFDVLVFSDVLEHLVEPAAVLRWYLRWLRPGGRVMVSVPNVVVWSNRLRILAGVIDPTDSGTMDRTHLRLFSFRLARRLMEEAGCRVVAMDSTPHLARAFLPWIKWWLRPAGQGPLDPRALIDSRAYRWYLRYLYPLERWVGSLWPTLLAFRIIVVGELPSIAGEKPIDGN
jgi:SAM-dependent methyltransferase